ncbi:MAG: DinB family protein [Candidatus Heimdallarchaeota archaeon]|nr:DinB family protein [Candidatus Heimdallarchaeota archaeon]
MKDSLISTLKIAEINFLMSFKEIKPELITKQIQKNTNHIAWIVGHCIAHFDWYLSIYTGNKLLSKEELDYYAYGVEKNEVVTFPYSFSELVDKHLQISDSFFKKLETLPKEKFDEIPSEERKEKLSDLLKRITLHIMGHTGQIVILRRMFDNPFWGFVGGVQVEQREEFRKKWLVWWKQNKHNY